MIKNDEYAIEKSQNGKENTNWCDVDAITRIEVLQCEQIGVVCCMFLPCCFGEAL